MQKNTNQNDGFLGLIFRLTSALVGSVLFAVLIAYFLQKNFGASGLVSVLLIVLGAACGFYLVFREINRIEKENDAKKKGEKQ